MLLASWLRRKGQPPPNRFTKHLHLARVKGRGEQGIQRWRLHLRPEEGSVRIMNTRAPACLSQHVIGNNPDICQTSRPPSGASGVRHQRRHQEPLVSVTGDEAQISLTEQLIHTNVQNFCPGRRKAQVDADWSEAVASFTASSDWLRHLH